MFRPLKLFALIICLLLIAVSMCSCVCQKNSTALVVMVGNHNNSIKFNADIENKLSKIYENKGQAYLICIDGAPNIEYEDDNSFFGDIPETVYTNNTGVKFLKNELKPYVEKFQKKFQEIEPNEPEVDILASFFEAEHIFDIDERTKREIIIYDSGLSTTGILNFCSMNYFNRSNNGDIVNELKSELNIPNLNGVKIDWYGLGNVAYPQEKLTNKQLEILENIWGSILKESGATVTFHGYPDNKNIISDYAAEVSVVDIDNVKRKEIYFKRDLAEFADKQQADTTIQEIISNINLEQNAKWCIIGCTASVQDNNDYDKLSKDRAVFVGKQLLNQGVPSDKLLFCSLGVNNPWHINNLDSDSSQIEEFAKSNRKVVVISTESDEFKRYKDILQSNYFTYN